MNLHKIKTYKVRNKLIEQYPYFIIEVTESSQRFSRIRGKDFSIIQVIKMLNTLIEGGKSFSNFYRDSNFGYRRSFINYLNLCVDFGFIDKEKYGDKIHSRTMFRLKEKGRIFLDLFKDASS